MATFTSVGEVFTRQAGDSGQIPLPRKGIHRFGDEMYYALAGRGCIKRRRVYPYTLKIAEWWWSSRKEKADEFWNTLRPDQAFLGSGGSAESQVQRWRRRPVALKTTMGWDSCDAENMSLGTQSSSVVRSDCPVNGWAEIINAELPLPITRCRHTRFQVSPHPGAATSDRKIEETLHLSSTPHRYSASCPTPLSLLVDDAVPEEQSPFTLAFCHAPLEEAYRSDTFASWLPCLRRLRWLHFVSDAWDTVDSIVFERGRRYETYAGFSLLFTLWYPVVITLAAAIFVSLPVYNKNTCASATVVQMLAYGIGNLAPSISAFGMIEHTKDFELAVNGSAGSREELAALMDLASRQTAWSCNIWFVFVFCSAIMATGTLIPLPVMTSVISGLGFFYVLRLKTFWGQLGMTFTSETWAPQL